MIAARSNNPPPESKLGPATFVLKRVTGEIEIRGATSEHLTYEQLNHPEYAFNHHMQIGDIWSVTGTKI
jgi:hypothetical protein